MLRILIFILCFTFSNKGYSQKNKSTSKNLVYVDKQGVMRWTKTNGEAAFFGINYTVPFAYGYRSHKALGIDLEKAIRQDIYHIARLGLDAFRVHVWDTEITDSLGNLLENDHLRLYDFLLAELKKRNIKTILTPIAFWGNGYPERDEKTPGFSSIYNKQQAVVNENAIKAQENYIRQLLKHINPYTKLAYQDDQDIIAAEINNEPHHSGPKEKTTEYVNRLVAAMKNTGWTKPIFYNISESPGYADAVAKANIDGVSFQWYPTGLVANCTLKGNYLPHVDYYRIPFGDTIPGYHNKARMSYEFDAADVLQPVMYPAMARSFRTAGFQWATQFAYDPMATAYGNTEYQTHYLNLAYTPSKAISLLIASKVFHRVPRSKKYGSYPADTVFDVFRISYHESLSEMNSDEEFYYSNSTATKPANISKLKYIAGVGSSPVVQYDGTGAYFLDKLAEGVWRLELMPDAIAIRDVFERASPKKEVTRIHWQANRMKIVLPGLGENFVITKKDTDDNTEKFSGETGFKLQPGVYLLRKNSPAPVKLAEELIKKDEFVAPSSFSSYPAVFHIPENEISPGHPFLITANVVGIDSTDIISVEFRHSTNQWKTVALQKTKAYEYSANVPAEMLVPGVLNYRIIIQKKQDEFYVFPGNHKGNPYSWDNNYINETWQTFIAREKSHLELFDMSKDRTEMSFYNTSWRNNTVQYVTTEDPGRISLKLSANATSTSPFFGLQYYVADKLAGRKNELDLFNKFYLRALGQGGPVNSKIILITKDAAAYSFDLSLDSALKEIEMDLNNFRKDSFLLLPRPYPGFLPLWFALVDPGPLKISNIEKLQLLFSEIPGKNSGKYEIKIESAGLKSD